MLDDGLQGLVVAVVAACGWQNLEMILAFASVNKKYFDSAKKDGDYKYPRIL